MLMKPMKLSIIGRRFAGDARARGLDHRRAQGARVVEGARLQDRAEGAVRDRVRPVVVGQRGDESEAPGHVVLEGRVARRLRGEQHAGVDDAPLVARHAEGPGLDDGLGAGLREVGEGLAGRAVHDPGRRLRLEVAADALEHLGDLLGRGGAVGDRVVGLQQVQRGVGVGRGRRGRLRRRRAARRTGPRREDRERGTRMPSWCQLLFLDPPARVSRTPACGHPRHPRDRDSISGTAARVGHSARTPRGRGTAGTTHRPLTFA